MKCAKLFATPVFTLAALAATAALPVHAADTAAAATTSEVGGTTLYSNWNIVQNTTKSPLHKTLIKAVSAAGLVDTLSAAGPFTLFAPTDKAFGRVPAKMTAWLMNPHNRDALGKVVKYHVVPGRITAAQLYKKIEAGGGTATLTTVGGGTLTFTEVQGNIKVEGTQGSTGFVTTPDVEQSNGMMHVINGVLMPKLG